MCGIAGCFSAKAEVNEQGLTRMRDALAHRGPDGSGLWVSERRHVGLAHRRLAIIDLSDAALQPMIHEHYGVALIFNGEIYNHRPLRAELEKQGCRFRTDHSDTEVLLQGYVTWGLDELLRRVNGMFAIAIYDPRGDQLILVRDRMGIKPLFVADVGGDMLFSSETKAFHQYPHFEAQLDNDNLWHFLAFRSLPAPRSLFRGVSRVEPGSYLIVNCRSGERSSRRYWSPIGTQQSKVTTDPVEAREQLGELLEDSVRLRLEADTNVGVFLSGGLDSTYLLRIASGMKAPLSTFTAAYPGYPAYDEARIAAESAAADGALHNEVPVTEERYLEALIGMAYHQDEPIAAPVCVPVYLLSEAARAKDVPVILAGEGSDEIFIGYTNWLRLRSAQQWINRLPAAVVKAGAAAAVLMASSFDRFDRPVEFLRRAKRGEPIFWGGAMDFSEAARNAIAGPALSPAAESTFDASIRPIWNEFLEVRDPRDVTAWMSYVDTRFRLPELMLPRLDKMGMAFSIEGRVPFLDHRVVELALNLPAELRAASGSVGKPLFKAHAASVLSQEMVYQRKRGFQAPVKEWKHGKFQQAFVRHLGRFADKTGLFDKAAVDKLLSRPGDRLYFSLINFMIWYCLFVDNVLPDVIPPRDSLVQAG